MQFHWKGAQVSGTVGGARAHPAKAEKNWTRKINKKENRKAINSAMCATLDKELVQQRGHIIPSNYPFALDSDFEKVSKTKDLLTALEELGFADELARGENGAKSLLIVSESEELQKAAKNILGVEVATVAQLNAHVLAPGTHAGRATLFTKTSIEALQ
jgi:large subunit ribosomal protein L4e